MVHSGSAAGGHYYACIKSFSDDQWYSFNDQHVSKVKLMFLLSWVHINESVCSYFSCDFSPAFDRAVALCLLMYPFYGESKGGE